MKTLASCIRACPRTTAALAFGTVTAAITHIAWIPSARLSGGIPLLTLSAGLAHAIAGAILGRRLLDEARTPTALQAGMVGACISLLAVLLFSPVFAFIVTDAHSTSAASYLMMTAMTGIFSFLGAGWALLLASAALGAGLQRAAATRTSTETSSTER